MKPSIKLHGMPHALHSAVAMLVDTLSAWLALWLAYSLRTETWALPTPGQWHIYLLAPILAIPIMIKLGLYKAIFRYTGFAAMLTTLKAIALYGVLFLACIIWLSTPSALPRSVGILQPILFLMLVGGSRAFVRATFAHLQSSPKNGISHSRVLIFGAGETGLQLVSALGMTKKYQIVGFIDHDPQKIGRSINGSPVWAPEKLAQVVRDHKVTDVLLAIPRQSQVERNTIIQSLHGLSVHVRSVPSMAELASGRASVQQFDELDLEDLLGRNPVPPVPELISRNITDKVVLVTGAGGSIGSELCRQILKSNPSALLLIEHNEFGLYAIYHELTALAATMPNGPKITPLLTNVRKLKHMREIMQTWQPHTVYHAAAYKHVPMVEHNPVQGLDNNVFGTLAVARAALEQGVPHFVLISTDKAVRPTNIMGASKRLAELCLQALANSAAPDFSVLDQTFGHTPAIQPAPNRTCFAMVRFGNVLGSSGSVVPLFRQQIAHGGPITLTHADVTRYFMTIPEAAQLVLQAGAMGQGGDVFVLDMGEPVQIMHLAHQMVTLSGLTVRDEQNPQGDIAIQVTGLRPGEKLYEELLIGDDPQTTEHPRIMKAHEQFLPWPELQQQLAQLQQHMQDHQIDAISQQLLELVNGYRAGPVVDWMLLQQKSTVVQ